MRLSPQTRFPETCSPLERQRSADVFSGASLKVRVAPDAVKVRQKGCKMPPESSLPGQQGLADDIRRALQQELGPRRYQHWFGGAARLEVSDSVLLVHVPSPYLLKWIQRQFEARLLSVAAEVVGPDVSIRYEVGSEVVLTPAPRDASQPLPAPASAERRTSVAALSPNRSSRARRSYSLNDFVVGEANALAVTAIQRIIDDVGAVSPLYLHGSVGNGKTHLLESLRSRLRKDQPRLQVTLLTAEQFGNYFAQALDARSLPSFRAKFRSVDALLIDDVDFFDGKKGFQEEFLHTVKQFEEGGRQLVVSSNRHPRLLTRTAEELVTRLLSGVVCRLEAPDESMRREIVRRHAVRQHARFADEALDHVADRFTSNVRELEGAVNLLATWSQMSRRTVTLLEARKLLGRLERDCLRIVRLADVEAAVCDFFALDAEALRSSCRKQSVSQPRMVAMYLARRLTQTAYSEIGDYFGGRNHSTVMSAERKIAEQLESQAPIRVASASWSLQDIVQTLEDRIKAG